MVGKVLILCDWNYQIALHSHWYHHTYRCDDTSGCVMQFWRPDDEHMCSKHVEAWNKLTVKQKFCASSWMRIACWAAKVTETHRIYRGILSLEGPNAIRQEIQAFSVDTLGKVFHNLEKRIQVCLDVKGDQFQHRLWAGPVWHRSRYVYINYQVIISIT